MNSCYWFSVGFIVAALIAVLLFIGFVVKLISDWSKGSS